MRNRGRFGWVCVVFAMALSAASAQTTIQLAPISLSVDLTDAPRKILHATERMPVTPGPLTLVYPKWIPGEHGPTGPIDGMAGFFITANGQPVKWERDPVEMYAYHLTVPQGVTQLEMKIDFLATAAPAGFSAGASTSANLALLSWNELLVYPDGSKASSIMFTPTVTVPQGWQFGTALELVDPASLSTTKKFRTVSLEQLVDSPVLAGRYFKEIPLAPEISPKHFLDIAGDGPEDIELSQEHIDEFSRLVRETGALYRSRHYGAYHFLVTLSDQVAHFGLEHHQSSDDRVSEKTFIDENLFALSGHLLPHEFTHSWNGKYRRPAGLATSDYQQPMIGDLLWVYEGLTEYLGNVLAVRCGIWSPQQYRERVAEMAADLDNRPGRTWRDLQDTTRDAQILYNAGGGWDNWRRGVDFYDEGELLWLDVDTTIRAKTDGKKSLNDFAAKFFGLGGDTAPKVVPYTFDDVVAGLNDVVPNDWAAFLRARLDSNAPHAPLGGIEAGGYKLNYAANPNAWELMQETASGAVNFWYSIGLRIGATGTVSDVLKDGIADKVGFGPGMQVIAVNGRGFTPTLLRAAIREAKDNGPAIQLIVENTGYYRIVTLSYHDGERDPVLTRVAGTPDRLGDILQPMAK